MNVKYQSQICPVCLGETLRDEYIYSKECRNLKNIENEIKLGIESDVINPRLDIMKILGGVVCKICRFDDVRALQLIISKVMMQKIGKIQECSAYVMLLQHQPKRSKKKLQVLCANHN